MASLSFRKMVDKYWEDHTHPVNHVLHVFVGWPMVGASIVLLPFKPLWSVGLFFGGYALMFMGHFVFEKNIPTVLKHPTAPFVIAWSVIRQIFGGLARLVAPTRGSADATAHASHPE